VPLWPAGPDGEKEPAELLRHTFDSAAEADMVISLLSAYGIPCFPYYEGEGLAGKIISGFSGFGAALYVPRSRLEEASALLAAEVLDDNDKEDTP
jgi:hypothetical protein